MRPVAALAAALLVGLLPGTAAAAWSATVGTTADLAAGTLPTPGAVSSSCSGTDDVLLTWSAEGAPAVAGFVVQRLSDARGATWVDVATVPAGAGSPWTYEDLDLPPAGYSHRVLPVNGAWTGATSAASAQRSIVETKGKKPRQVTCS